jgi:hypothetical protein
MPLVSRLTFVVLILMASLADAQTTASLVTTKSGNRRAREAVNVCDLNMAVANSDTVVTTGASSRVTLGLRVLGKVDENLINQFKKAWTISKAGLDSTEGVVLIFLMTDGSYTGRSPGTTNEFEQASFKWDPAALAIVHTHPNLINARPSRIDQATSERLGIPIFTITNRGMYVYNPTTGVTTRVMDDMDWLDRSKWASRMLRHPTLLDEYSDLSY